jgi:hypothetical protein
MGPPGWTSLPGLPGYCHMNPGSHPVFPAPFQPGGNPASPRRPLRAPLRWTQ